MEQKTQQEFESTFASIRGELRLLRGKLDTRLTQAFYQPVEGFTPAEQKNLKEMRNIVNRAIGVMDRYEDIKRYNDEFEQQTIRLVELVHGRADR